MTMDLGERVVLDDQHPWPGLASFDENAHAWFRGRDNEIGELFRLVESATVTVLYGVAGLGKTSLLQAGLFPRLREANWLPVPVRLDVSTTAMPLVEQVFAALERELPDPERRPSRLDGETLWEFFHRRDSVFWSERHRILRPVLVFDQFEELFTVGRQAPGRAELLEQIADLGEGRPPARVIEALASNPDAASAFDPARHRYAIVFSLREDYVAELDALRSTMRSLGTTRMRLTRMDGNRAIDVVHAGRHLVDEETTLAIVRFVAKSDHDAAQMDELEVEPALLSVVCSELNNRRIEKELPKIDRALLDLNRDTILEDFYEDAIAPFPPHVRKFVEEELLTPTGARASVYSDQADEGGVDRETIRGLVDCRLVRVETRGRADRIELTHDLLTDVIVASRNRRREIEKREAEVARIAAEKREAWVRRRLQLTNIALLVAVGALIAAGVFWFRARVTKKEAAATTAWWSFTAARDQLANDRDAEALAYLANAIRSDPTHVDARRLAIHLLLTRLWYVPQKHWTFAQPVQFSGISRDGKRAFAVTGEHLWLIDVARGGLADVPLNEEIASAQLTRDGARIVTVGASAVTVWDTANGKKVDGWTENEAIDGISLSPDSRFIAVATGDVVHLRAAPGVERFLATPNAWERAMQFGPDGSQLGIAWSVAGENRVQFRTYEVQTGAERANAAFATTSEPSALLVAPTLANVAVINRDGIELRTPGESEPDTVAVQAVSGVEFAPDGKSIVYVSDRRANVWFIGAAPDNEGWLVDSLVFGEDIQEAKFAADGSRVITTSSRGFVRVWSAHHHAALSPLFADVSALAITGAGDALLTTTGRVVTLRRTPGLMQLAIPSANGAVVSADESTIYARGAQGIEVLSATSGLRSRANLAGFTDVIAPRAGSIICVKDEFGWSALDTRTNHRVALPEPRERFGGRDQVALFVSADGTRALLVRIGAPPFAAVVYDLATGTALRSFERLPGLGILRSARISADGKRVAFASVKLVAVADVATGKVVNSEERDRSIEFDPAGARLLVTQDKSAQILDAATLKPIGEPFNQPGDVANAVFSRDGKTFAALQEDGAVQVWQIQPPKQLAYQVRSGSSAANAEFSPGNDKLLIVSTEDPFEMSVWDANKGTPVTLPSESIASSPPQFGNSGRRLASAGMDMVRIIELAEGTEEEALLVADFAEYVAGLRFDEGKFDSVDKETFELPAGAPKGDVAKIVACFQSNDRTVTPFTSVKLRDFIAQRTQIDPQARRRLALVYPGK